MYAIQEITSAMREMLKLGKEELYNGNAVRMVANVGVTEPGIWNLLKNDLYDNLSLGMTFKHCTGPVVCTDDSGSNAVLDAAYAFPEVVSIELNRVYEPTHWMFVDGKNNFKVLVEGYHDPLQEERLLYSACPGNPIGRYLIGEFDWELETLKLVRDRPAPREIPTIKESSLRTLLLRKVDFDTMSAKKIYEILSSDV